MNVPVKAAPGSFSITVSGVMLKLTDGNARVSSMVKVTPALSGSTSYTSPLASSKSKVSTPSPGPSSNTSRVRLAVGAIKSTKKLLPIPSPGVGTPAMPSVLNKGVPFSSNRANSPKAPGVSLLTRTVRGLSSEGMSAASPVTVKLTVNSSPSNNSLSVTETPTSGPTPGPPGSPSSRTKLPVLASGLTM